MWTYLKYQGKRYDNFLINTNGQVNNLKTGNVYKITYNKKGYAIITLPMGKRGKVKSIRLHRAIAETFIPNPNKLPVVNHIDECCVHNSADNLEWVSYQDNSNHGTRNERIVRERKIPVIAFDSYGDT
jgi:hypothetical protein